MGRFSGMRARLLGGSLLVIAAGTITLVVVVGLLAPRFFGGLMARMMGPGWGHMGPSAGAMGGMSEITTAAYRDSVTLAILIAASAAVAVAVAVSLFTSARLSAPIRRIAHASRRIAAGDYGQRVEVTGDDEIAALADSFNRMATSLEEAEARRTAVIGDVAHELRTPLSTISGYMEGLLDGVVEPNAQTWTRVHAEAARLGRLVDDLQELSRAEARQLELRLEAWDPGALAERAAAGLRDQFAAKGLTLELAVADHLPKVRADADRAIQVLANLLANALRHTSQGGVRILAEPDSTAVRFEVRDTGAGIPSDALPHVFERFYRVDRSRSREAGGTGIGLAIVKALVEAMDGKVWAFSQGPGSGATFGFTLPYA